jgi:hypothetical protein
MAGLATLALASVARSGDGDDPRARKLMEEAFNRRYRWAEDFKGFAADFSCRREGRTVRGTVRADVTKPHGGVEVMCEDDGVKKLVQSTIASTVMHSRASRFDAAFGDCTFAIEGEGSRGGTKIKVSGHGFFKDFTVKDGHIIENHGGHGAISSEVTVRQVVWMADSSKTLPREYAFRIKTGEREEAGTTAENWREVDGVWLPSEYHMTGRERWTPTPQEIALRYRGQVGQLRRGAEEALRNAPVESTLQLENIKIERGR